jgi:hypothetical protein
MQLHNLSYKKLIFSSTFWLFLSSVVIIVFGQYSYWVEHYYYQKFYPIISNVQRWLVKTIPFSLGDVLYSLAIFYLIARLFVTIKAIVQSPTKKTTILRLLHKALNFCLVVFIIFKLIWGLNYNRLGVAYQFKLQKQVYTTAQLEDFLSILIVEANTCRKQIVDSTLQFESEFVYKEAETSYKKIAQYLPFLTVSNFTIKPSLHNDLYKYLGCTGYYNPLSGEAHFRTNLPSVLQPIVACHEVAHQLGYASEDEADFIAILVANESDNIYFKYSLLIDLIRITHRNLFKIHASQDNKEGYLKIKSIYDCRIPQVKKDMTEIVLFFDNESTKLTSATQKIQSEIFDNYLKLNNMPMGIETYNEVLGWLLAYRQKYSAK